MVLYECHVKDSSVWFDHHAGATGEACYSPNMPPEWTFCLATNAWAWVSTIKFLTPDFSTPKLFTYRLFNIELFEPSYKTQKL